MSDSDLSKTEIYVEIQNRSTFVKELTALYISRNAIYDQIEEVRSILNDESKSKGTHYLENLLAKWGSFESDLMLVNGKIQVLEINLRLIDRLILAIHAISPLNSKL